VFAPPGTPLPPPPPPADQLKFKKHMEAAQKIHTEGGKQMYTATEQHQGEGGHLATYINQTVRNVFYDTTSLHKFTHIFIK
jgi:hypothetical protein